MSLAKFQDKTREPKHGRKASQHYRSYRPPPLPPSWSCSRRPRRPFFSNVRINPFMGVVSRIHCLSPILLPGGLLGVVVAFTPANGRYRNFRHSVWWRHGTHEKEKRWKWTDDPVKRYYYFGSSLFRTCYSTIMENIVVAMGILIKNSRNLNFPRTRLG